jgi:hypothetical protein
MLRFRRAFVNKMPRAAERVSVRLPHRQGDAGDRSFRAQQDLRQRAGGGIEHRVARAEVRRAIHA